MSAKIAVIIISWNVAQYLKDCLTSLYLELERNNINGTVWVVDNNSSDNSVALVQAEFPKVNLIVNEQNLGFGQANNQGIAAAKAEIEPDYFFLLNSDTVVQPNSIQTLVQFMEQNPKAGLIGPRLIYGDGRLQHSAFHFPGIGQLLFDLFPLPTRFYQTKLNGRYPSTAFAPNAPPFAIDFPLGAAMFLRRAAVDATNGFDEQYHMYCEEIDWAWRLHQTGWDCFAVPMAEIIHFGGESSKQIPAQSIRNLWQSRAQLYQQHHSPLYYQLSRMIAKIGLLYQAKKEKERHLKTALLDAVHYW